MDTPAFSADDRIPKTVRRRPRLQSCSLLLSCKAQATAFAVAGWLALEDPSNFAAVLERGKPVGHFELNSFFNRKSGQRLRHMPKESVAWNSPALRGAKTTSEAGFTCGMCHAPAKATNVLPVPTELRVIERTTKAACRLGS